MSPILCPKAHLPLWLFTVASTVNTYVRPLSMIYSLPATLLVLPIILLPFHLVKNKRCVSQNAVEEARQSRSVSKRDRESFSGNVGSTRRRHFGCASGYFVRIFSSAILAIMAFEISTYLTAVSSANSAGFWSWVTRTTLLFLA